VSRQTDKPLLDRLAEQRIDGLPLEDIMPFYNFLCPACGPFTVMRPMARRADPGACPGCGAAAPRSISAPAILRGGAGRGAQDGLATVERGASGSAHPAGCGCCVRRSPAVDGVAAAGGRVFTQYGPM
jgi:putative FmdB family regulatory protein